jgi:hypothetical protein
MNRRTPSIRSLCSTTAHASPPVPISFETREGCDGAEAGAGADDDGNKAASESKIAGATCGSKDAATPLELFVDTGTNPPGEGVEATDGSGCGMLASLRLDFGKGGEKG